MLSSILHSAPSDIALEAQVQPELYVKFAPI